LLKATWLNTNDFSIISRLLRCIIGISPPGKFFSSAKEAAISGELTLVRKIKQMEVDSAAMENSAIEKELEVMRELEMTKESKLVNKLAFDFYSPHDGNRIID